MYKFKMASFALLIIDDKTLFPSLKLVRVMKTPYIPLLYSKTGVYRGIHYFLIFALKHRFRVLVRGGSNVYPQSMFCAKI